MINMKRIVQVNSGTGDYLGKVIEEKDNKIRLTDVCSASMTPGRVQGTVNFNVTKMDRDVIIQGTCTILELKEEDELYKGYVKARSGITLATEMPRAEATNEAFMVFSFRP